VRLFGVPVNPAMVARVMRAAHPGPLVNLMHASVITAGLSFGTWVGCPGIDVVYGLAVPGWVGFSLAVLGLARLATTSVRRLSLEKMGCGAESDTKTAAFRANDRSSIEDTGLATVADWFLRED
jgi:hypothetical protein